MSDPHTDATVLMRARDRDRYLAALLAREPARGYLLALYAVDIEIGDVADKVSEPLIGEMRLQWWRDAIGAMAHGAASGNPLADGLLPAIAHGRLPITAFDQMVEAHRQDLYGEGMRNENELLAYCGATYGIAIQLACLILGAGTDRQSGTAAGHAGVVAGILWVLENMGSHAARGRIYLPATLLARHDVSADAVVQGVAPPGLTRARADLLALAEARIAVLNGALASVDATLRPAFAHLASAPARLTRLRGGDPLAPPRPLSPLYRQWKIWRFGASGAL